MNIRRTAILVIVYPAFAIYLMGVGAIDVGCILLGKEPWLPKWMKA